MTTSQYHTARHRAEINDVTVWADEFAWDGCHRIYVVTSPESRAEMLDLGYQLRPITELPDIWDRSCPLRFISSADLTIAFVRQMQEEPTIIRINTRSSR